MSTSVSRFFFIACWMLLSSISFAQLSSQPKPSGRQKQWADMEFYLFVHFGPNTFTDLEWGKGSEKEEVFNPTNLDCRQWCRIAKAAGAKGIILTAKHHDGFCLWPSQYSTHTVRESKWRNGKGDVLKELQTACKEYGLKMGVYLSPWDRNHPKYGTEEYNQVYISMMKEVVSRYGPFFEFWWDGANGEGPNGKKQLYDWKAFEQTMRTIAPNTAVFSDIGPDIRWVGNEHGFAGTTDWNTLDSAGFTRGAGAPSQDTLNTGNRFGKAWLPAECDVSIRPGWFYHTAEDTAVKTGDELFDLYLKSVGRGAALLLNVPPDRRGLFTSYDSAALMDFKKKREESFANNICKGTRMVLSNGKNSSAVTDENDNTYFTLQQNDSATISFSKPTELNCVLLKEWLTKGQNVARFHLAFYNEQKKQIRYVNGTTIGRKRILTFPTLQVSSITITIDDENAPTFLSEIGAYKIADSLIEE